MLTENVIEVEKHVQAACDRAGRSRDEVTLIAVSKTKPVSDIEEVLTTGILDYGENKVQELSDKYEVLPKTSVISVKIKYRNSAARWSSFHQISAGI